jgi:hypothetical protein
LGEGKSPVALSCSKRVTSNKPSFGSIYKLETQRQTRGAIRES